MKHCKGCSHPTICNTMGCGAEEARANKAKAAEPSYAEIKAQRDELLEALRKALNELPRYSFLLDAGGGVSSVRDRCGRWIEWSAAHSLFDPAVADQLLAKERAIAKAEGKEGGAG